MVMATVTGFLTPTGRPGLCSQPQASVPAQFLPTNLSSLLPHFLCFSNKEPFPCLNFFEYVQFTMTHVFPLQCYSQIKLDYASILTSSSFSQLTVAKQALGSSLVLHHNAKVIHLTWSQQQGHWSISPHHKRSEYIIARYFDKGAETTFTPFFEVCCFSHSGLLCY